MYENALAIELRDCGLEFAQQVPIDVYYRGQLVGIYQADLVVNGLVIVELKAVEQPVEVHEIQPVNYLRATQIEVGLLINFGMKLEVKRRIFTNDRKVAL